jgi:hypothetical protein
MFNKIEVCKNIKANISNLSANEIDELFKILHKNKTNYTKNNNGIFINLNWLDDDIIIQIDNYINFCLKSQKEINKYEIMRNLLTDSINNSNKERHEETINDNKPIQQQTTNSNQISINNLSLKQKTSSSMKFYLLKKKYLKQNIITTNNNDENKLTHEEYLL